MYSNNVSLFEKNDSMGDFYPTENAGKFILSMMSAMGLGAGAYHGYKRNNSLGWAAWWGVCGALVPVFTVAVAVAQGFGEPKK